MAKKVPTLQELKKQINSQMTTTPLAQSAASKQPTTTSSTGYDGGKAGASAGAIANAKPTKATQGLLPKTDYNFNTFVGGDAVQDKIRQATGAVRDTSKASGMSMNPNNTPWESNVEAIKAKYPDLFVGGGSYKPASYSTLSNISAFAPSQAYIDAMAYTNQLLEKINSGRTSYSDRVDAMMDKIANRDAFSYDFNTDPLFQNALASAMASGQVAMEDTMGQASALTGGYGSSYATSAANQAYNSFVQDAYAQLPDYYNLALNAYNMEGNELYNQLGMYRDADNTEYGRLMDAYGANYNQAQNMYAQEYDNYWDTANYNFNVDRYNADAAQQAEAQNYQRYKDAMNFALDSKSTGSATPLSNAEFNTIKSEVQDAVKKWGNDSNQVDEAILMYANNYDLTEAQIQQLYSIVGNTEYKAGYTLSDKNGVPVVTDKNGKPYQGAFQSFELTKKASDKNNNEYTDPATGQTFTYAQLKARGWDKYIKK